MHDLCPAGLTAHAAPAPSGVAGRPVAVSGLAGLFHPAGGTAGVLMLGPWGFEEACSRIGWRRLAETLAARGYPVLRFDWPGTGDSLDPADGEGGLAAWRRAVRDGLDALAAIAGVERIAVLGLGIGADLAAETAGLDRVGALVLAAPVVSGRLYTRELAAWSGMIASSGIAPGAAPDGGLTVAGHRMRPDLLADMKRFDATAGLAASDIPVLVVGRGDGARETPLAARLAALGARVERLPFEGFEGWMTDPTNAVVPDATLSTVVERLVALLPPGGGPAARTADVPPARLRAAGFQETAVRFGPDDRLFGVRCDPAGGSTGGPAVLFINSGRDSHVGWGRSAVEHARRLAAAGVSSLRMDLGGLGEALPDPAGPAEPLYSDAHQRDVGAAVALLGAEGHDGVVLVGRCSGAYAAIQAAARTPGVAGVVAVNPLRLVWDPKEKVEEAIKHSFKSVATYPRQLLDVLTGRRTMGSVPWGKVARSVVKRVAERVGSTVERAAGPIAPRSSRFRRCRALFGALDGARIPVRLVYSVNDGGLDELAIHFGKGGKGLSRYRSMAMVMVPDSDHNMTPPAARDRLHAVIEDVARTVAGNPPSKGGPVT